MLVLDVFFFFFRLRRSEEDYVLVRSDGTGCSSFLGKKGGSQTLNIQTGVCSNSFLHEILHAVGMFHEENRPDRDSYVKIHWENIQKGKELQHMKMVPLYNYVLQFPYDEKSIMHPPYNISSINGGPTITSKRGLANEFIGGNSNRLTSIDILKIKSLFNC